MNSLYVWPGYISGNWLNCCFRIPDFWYGSTSQENNFFPFQLVRIEFNHVSVNMKGDDFKSRIHNIFLHCIDPSVSLSLTGQWTTFATFPFGLVFCTSLILLSIWSCLSLYNRARNVAESFLCNGTGDMIQKLIDQLLGRLTAQNRAVIFCFSCFGFTSWLP